MITYDPPNTHRPPLSLQKPSNDMPDFSYAPSQATTSFDGKRTLRSKELQFVQKYGHRHHTYDSEKAPYPLSYDKDVLELEALDTKLTQHLRGSVSFADLDQHPTRVLDLGCGSGAWIIDAAKEWPECEFVGFDLVNVQMPLNIGLLEPSISTRIVWKHGNFLTTKLPFDDDDFDLVHVRSITKGVPENKWDVLFEEIHRVLQPGGTVEIVEEDTIFPVLPRWFTGALRASRKSTVTGPSYQAPKHDHALLESLMKSVFETRFINMTPTALLPSYFTTYFRQVTISPVITLPMPLLAPLLPVPDQVVVNYVIEPSSDSLEKRYSTIFPPVTTLGRPTSHSFSSGSMNSFSTVMSRSSIFSKRPRTASATLSSPFSTRSSTVTTPSQSPSRTTSTSPPASAFNHYIIEADEDGIANSFPKSLFPVEQLTSLSDRSLAMHLYRSFQTVLACQEAMYEELKHKLRQNKEEVVALGWEDDEELADLEPRQRYEKLVGRFKHDMHVRLGFWTSLTGLGWKLPPREPLSKADLIEEERIHEAMYKASQSVTTEEVQTPCRSVRVLIGHKS